MQYPYQGIASGDAENAAESTPGFSRCVRPAE